MFGKGGMTIEDEALNYILEWSRRHTFYTQTLCNEIFAHGNSSITFITVQRAIRNILDNESMNFLQIRNLITPQQWRILMAVAKEGAVSQITSNAFLTKYRIGSATNCRRAIESLTEKELILEDITPTAKSYQVYNVFFSRWLENL